MHRFANHLFRHWPLGRHAPRLHGHRHRGHGGRHSCGAPGDRAEQLLARISARLDLTATQQEHLTELLAQLQRQRRALSATAAGPELAGLFASENFDRATAARLFDARLDALRDAGPALLGAAGDFYDSLDFEQQQALRFVLRVRRARPL